MKIRIDLKILIFLIIFYFTHQIKSYLIVMFFSIFHEMGHILTGLILKEKLEKIEIMPFGFSACFGYKYKEKYYSIKEIIITLAGPCTSGILAILCKYIDMIYITKHEAIYVNLLIMFFNLMPLYPLDGGRILKRILHIKFDTIKTETLITKITEINLIILTITSSILVYYYKNIAIFLICIFLWIIVKKEKNGKSIAILQ